MIVILDDGDLLPGESYRPLAHISDYSLTAAAARLFKTADVALVMRRDQVAVIKGARRGEVVSLYALPTLIADETAAVRARRLVEAARAAGERLQAAETAAEARS